MRKSTYRAILTIVTLLSLALMTLSSMLNWFIPVQIIIFYFIFIFVYTGLKLKEAEVPLPAGKRKTFFSFINFTLKQLHDYELESETGDTLTYKPKGKILKLLGKNGLLVLKVKKESLDLSGPLTVVRLVEKGWKQKMKDEEDTD